MCQNKLFSSGCSPVAIVYHAPNAALHALVSTINNLPGRLQKKPQSHVIVLW